ncbi:MAG: 2-oxoacid:acceptor oxidoreductase subunit alpha [Flavobacteriales bacterium]
MLSVNDESVELFPFKNETRIALSQAKKKSLKQQKEVTVLFAGDSGDGMQLTGDQFSNTSALQGNDIATFPNYPAEIRAPQGTLAGVSGFQLKFGAIEVFTPGDRCDVLVAMNAAALKVNLDMLQKGGVIIANTAGFDKKNLKLAKYEEDESPLEDPKLSDFTIIDIDVTKLTREALEGFDLKRPEKDRCKNMFVLGFIYYMYSRELEKTIDFLNRKFGKKPEVRDANIKALKAGYNLGDTTEIFSTRYEVEPAPLPKGTYRNIVGNQATALALIAASKKAELPLFYGSYPITPASTILHELSKHKNFGVKTFQAEDEIGAICAGIGASFGGSLAATASAGPGIALKTESLGLAVMLELPLLLVNVQRGGPSTGLPTKTEQADLLQALYGRNGEAPVPVVAASTPSDCFEATYEAARIALEHMTPVLFLSDGYIANGAEPWRFPSSKDLQPIHPPLAEAKDGSENGKAFMPYERDEQYVRKWALPGMRGLQHRIGGLEKEDRTGNVSYDPENHEKMVEARAKKVEAIRERIPEMTVDSGSNEGELLILGWGSTYGVIKTVVRDLQDEGYEVGHAHLRHLNPLPSGLKELLGRFRRVLVPEMNTGQLQKVIRHEFLVDAIGFNKVQGVPIAVEELKEKAIEMIQNEKVPS